MSTRTSTPNYPSGGRISERATRGALAQFRSAAAKRAPVTARGASKAPGPDRRDLQRASTDPQILRRWRIADLIAAASRRSAFAS